QNDAACYQRWLFRSLKLQCRLELDACAGRLTCRLHRTHAQPDAASDFHWFQEADAFVTVVEAAAAPSYGENLPLQPGDKRQEIDPMGDGLSTRHVPGGALRVDMHPVVVTGEPGKIIDILLLDQKPVRRPYGLTRIGLKVGGMLNRQHHAP